MGDDLVQQFRMHVSHLHRMSASEHGEPGCSLTQLVLARLQLAEAILKDAPHATHSTLTGPVGLCVRGCARCAYDAPAPSQEKGDGKR